MCIMGERNRAVGVLKHGNNRRRTDLGVQSLPHLGAAVGDEHGPVLVDMHKGAALL